MTKLSVNINKLATLRNARGGNNPDLMQAIQRIQQFGADGITVHPRPDERHIRYDDVRGMRSNVFTEFNIEGNPKEEKFVELVLETRPDQVTLVPDASDQLTSNHGWDTIKEAAFLKQIITVFKDAGIRVSIFLDPKIEQVAGAKQCGADRIELYTEAYARSYPLSPQQAMLNYLETAAEARRVGLEMNAGHDLDLNNLAYFNQHIPDLCEVSIGHALVCDALWYGFENTVQLYKRCLQP
ncbi:MAG: pyridoxine 5'-phosphate synthase [Chitinophagaceae bacterium]|nr:pyridoxine 5'-phosphate synthase [Chitinophagaceae bacterium]